MGYLTTFTIYNDDCDAIIKHPKEFTEKIHNACCKMKKDDHNINVGNATIIPQTPKHASDLTLYIHEGNHVYEPSIYDDQYLIWLKRNPEHHLNIIKNLKYKLSKIEKICKNQILVNKENNKK